MESLLPFREIWTVDFEFHPDRQEGGVQVPVCMVAKEHRSGVVLRYWQDELRAMDRPPLDIGPDSLFVAYLASAELHCHLSIGWPMPENILDAYAEFRTLTNGRQVIGGRGLLGAATWFNVDSIDATEKTEMRDLILCGGPWSNRDIVRIVDYCQSDVDLLDKILPRLVRALEGRPQWMAHALHRGSYTRAVAAMEYRGVPIDTDTLERLVENWDWLKLGIIDQVCAEFDVFEGPAFKVAKFEQLLVERNLGWLRTDNGNLALDKETFRQQVRAYPELAPIHEVRSLLGKLRLTDLQVGPDGRNRALLGIFGSKTGRNQPSNSRFVFGPSKWMRSLIKPEPGMGVSYVDFTSQETAIAAALSGDRAMMEGYASGDPYIDFAIRSGLAPADATKASHEKTRDQCKQVVLGTQYGMQARTLSNRLQVDLLRGEQLLRAHRETYSTYQEWVSNVVDYGYVNGYLDTVYGWRLQVEEDTRPTTLQNFLMQGNGAEMLRLACIMAYDEGLQIIAPVHDALLLESPIETLESDTRKLQEIMSEAGRMILQTMSVGTEAETVVAYPGRYMDKRGKTMWKILMELLGEPTVAKGRTNSA